MRDTGGAPRGGTEPGKEPEAVLRAKYLDYCSSQVADLLLLLSPDQIYLVAQEAAQEAESPADLRYDEIVALATDRIAKQLVLPPFEVWVEDYRRNPEYYDRYFMGLWESEASRIPEG